MPKTQLQLLCSPGFCVPLFYPSWSMIPLFCYAYYLHLFTQLKRFSRSRTITLYKEIIRQRYNLVSGKTAVLHIDPSKEQLTEPENSPVKMYHQFWCCDFRNTNPSRGNHSTPKGGTDAETKQHRGGVRQGCQHGLLEDQVWWEWS